MTTARKLAWLHVGLAAGWATIGTAVTLANPDSVLWVAAMSVYAIVVSHLAAYDAARAERKQEEA